MYGDYELQLNIETFAVMQGELPPNKLNKLIKWCKLNQKGLFENWQLAKEMEELFEIKGL